MILGHRRPLSLRSRESLLSSCHLTFLQMFLWIGGCSANGLAGPCGPCAARHCLSLPGSFKRIGSCVSIHRITCNLFLFFLSDVWTLLKVLTLKVINRWVILKSGSATCCKLPQTSCGDWTLPPADKWTQASHLSCQMIFFFVLQTNTHFHAQAEYTRQNKHPHSLS